MDTYDNLVDLFERSAARHADRPLFGVRQRGAYQWLDYREVAEAVDACRAGLAGLGVKAHARVAIISDNRPEWAIAAYATYGLGAWFVPMYEAQSAHDWEFILRDSGASVLLVANRQIAAKCHPMLASEGGLPGLEHLVVLSDSGPLALSFDDLLARGRAHPVPSAQPDPDDLCGLIYTSGTHGQPKGVLLSHRNITSNINAFHQVFPMGPDDVSLSILPWAHSFGQTCELHCMLSYGGAIGLAESVSTLLDNLLEVRPTILFAVPRTFHRIYDSMHRKMADVGGLRQRLFGHMREVARVRRDLSASGRASFATNLQHSVLDRLVTANLRDRFGGRLKYAFSGGAALATEVAEFIDDLGISLYEGYGLTETSPVATTNSPLGRKIGSIGRPLPGVSIRLAPVDDVPADHGEILVYGPNVMRGYHERPAETAAVLTGDGGLRTGDLGRIDSDGFIFITGRIKDQYKLENGKYVAPAPIEELLRVSPYIANIMVDGANRPHNAAIVVADLDALERWARQMGLPFEQREELVGRVEVNRLIASELERLGAALSHFERPQAFVLIAEDFTTDNQMLTPSLKLRRRDILARYSAELDRLYGR